MIWGPTRSTRTYTLFPYPTLVRSVRVLAVHDDEVEAEALAQPREMRRNSIAARPADHIPAEQNSHEPYAFLAGCAPPLGAAPASVTTRSSGWSVASRGDRKSTRLNSSH